MANTPFQPTLPAPTNLTDQELNFLDDSPPNLFAENQDSNFGAFRKVFSDQMKMVADQIQTLYTERFVFTASQTLDQWEEEVGLPINPGSLSVQQRRARILARRQKGPFTRTRRQQVVETYLLSTFGQTTQLTLLGAAITPAGLPLYSDATSLVGLYTITEDISNFSYTVTINSSAQIDQAGLLRELSKITPAGINFTVTYTGQPNPPQTIRKAGGAISVASANGNRSGKRIRSGGAIAIGRPGGTEAISGTSSVRRAVITWVEVDVPDNASGSTTRSAQITWADLQTP